MTGEALSYEIISGGYRLVAEGVKDAEKKSDKADVDFTVMRK